jgi:hypothetical protein
VACTTIEFACVNVERTRPCVNQSSIETSRYDDKEDYMHSIEVQNHLFSESLIQERK